MAKAEVIISTSEYRPCWIKGRKALFHRWEDKACQLSTGNSEKLTLAIIEYEDGTVHEAYPYEIVFCDNKISEYYFEELQGKEE